MHVLTSTFMTTMPTTATMTPRAPQTPATTSQTWSRISGRSFLAVGPGGPAKAVATNPPPVPFVDGTTWPGRGAELRRRPWADVAAVEGSGKICNLQSRLLLKLPRCAVTVNISCEATTHSLLRRSAMALGCPLELV